MRITLTAINELGTFALKQHYEESLKLNRVVKAQQRLLGLRKDLLCHEPFTIMMEISRGKLSALVNPKHIAWQIEEDMKQNNAVRDIDYTLFID